MKCPQCGHWNRASFPRCFSCGAPLPKEGNEADAPEWQQEIAESFSPKTYIDVDEDGNITSNAPDVRDSVAAEMQSLKSRKERGEENQRRLRMQDTEPMVSVSTGRRVQTTSRRRVIFTDANAPSAYDETIRDGAVRGDVAPVYTAQRADYDDFSGSLPPNYQPLTGEARPARSPNAGAMTMRPMRAARSFGIHRFLRVMIILLLAAGLGLTGYFLLYRPLFGSEKLAPLQERTIISASIYDDLPAHIIKIPAEEGTEIYIKELHLSNAVIGGYATFEVADYVWYEDNEDIDVETYTVTMTPYLKTASGEHKLMETLHFDIDIPLSPLTLISPDVTYLEVNSRPTYQVEFQVERGSTVTINGENMSDLVSTQNGLISYNATVQAIGENVITIECKTKYYRKNTVTLVLYREPQDILLELDSTLSTSYNVSSEMTISGTTLNKATITVLSPYKDLDTSQLLTTGRFSFTALFNKIGTNTVIIQASYPGRETTTVTFDVYHVPSATNYTRTAWAMDAYNYTQYLETLAARVRNTTVYVCKGTIVEIISTSPQMALMETGTEDNSRQVLLENKSNDTWKVGDSLRVYADAFGAYNGKPWLIGRYTYSYTPQ